TSRPQLVHEKARAIRTRWRIIHAFDLNHRRCPCSILIRKAGWRGKRSAGLFEHYADLKQQFLVERSTRKLNARGQAPLIHPKWERQTRQAEKIHPGYRHHRFKQANLLRAGLVSPLAMMKRRSAAGRQQDYRILFHLAQQTAAQFVARGEVFHYGGRGRFGSFERLAHELRTGPVRLILAARDEIANRPGGQLAKKEPPEIRRPFNALGTERLDDEAYFFQLSRRRMNRVANRGLHRYIVETFHQADFDALHGGFPQRYRSGKRVLRIVTGHHLEQLPHIRNRARHGAGDAQQSTGMIDFGYVSSG